MTKEKIEKQVQRFKAFMKRYGLYFHPLHNMDERAGVVVKLGHCICDPKRPLCPCRQAIWEIRRTGNCFCFLFFSKEGLLEHYPKQAKEILSGEENSDSIG